MVVSTYFFVVEQDTAVRSAIIAVLVPSGSIVEAEPDGSSCWLSTKAICVDEDFT